MTDGGKGGLAAALLLLWAGTGALPAQEPQEPPSPRSESISVYLDFQTFGGDFDFYRREIDWVNWVRDRRDSDVHVLVTSEATGGGGRAFEVVFLGRGSFEAKSDTLTHFSGADATSDDRREALARLFALGLVPYASRLPVAGRLSVSYDVAGEDPAAGGVAGVGPEDDPWNFWSFRIRAGGSFQGESSVTSNSIDGSIAANRVTPEWKIRINAGGRYREQDFETGERTITSLTRDLNASLGVVNSVGERWGTGVRIGANASTRRNQELALSVTPAVEYNVFPYEESSRRSFVFQYRIGPNHFRYDEETIFGRMEETRVDQALEGRLSLRQPWGSATVSLEGAHYLHDLARNRITAFTGLRLRLFRGFSLNLSGRYSRIRDQLHLPLGDVPEEDVLLRIRELETDFDYNLSLGFSYEFGSIYNNVVNPRLDSFGGGFFFFR